MKECKNCGLKIINEREGLRIIHFLGIMFFGLSFSFVSLVSFFENPNVNDVFYLLISAFMISAGVRIWTNEKDLMEILRNSDKDPDNLGINMRKLSKVRF